MAVLVVLPGERSHFFAKQIARQLQSCIEVSACTPGLCSLRPRAPLALVALSPGQRLHLGEGCVFVCLEPCSQAIPAKQAQLLLWEGLSLPPGLSPVQTVSLGLGSKNTVTVSSITPAQAVFSLQRTIQTLDGHPLEPCEAALSLGSFDRLPAAMAAAALLWLCRPDKPGEG